VSALDEAAFLGTRLDFSAIQLTRLSAYYRGLPTGLQFVAPEIVALTAGRVRPLQINFSRVVVDAFAERLEVAGFRIPNAPDSDPDTGLWSLWTSCGLDASSPLAHTDALLYGSAFALAWADEYGDPAISVESALTMAVRRDPVTRQPISAFKRWRDPVDNVGRGIVFGPDVVSTLITTSPMPFGAAFPATGAGWAVSSTLPNPLGVVPVVGLVNRPSLGTAGMLSYEAAPIGADGESELVDVLPICDAIVKLSSDLMVSSETASMPRRWAVGLQLPEAVDPISGELTGDIDPDADLSAVSGRTWIAESSTAKFGQFPVADLSGYLDAIRALIEILAGVTGIPSSYFGGGGGQAARVTSADALRASETSMVRRAVRKQVIFGAAWGRVMALAVAIRDGSPVGPAPETVWQSAETMSEASTSDSAAKLGALGVPLDVIASKVLGWSPEDIADLRASQRSAALLSAGTSLAPLLPAAVPPAAPVAPQALT
jgi:hypothetical protein